jgi:copper(I)-binding protein
MKRFLCLALLFLALPAVAQVEIQNPWSRATPPGAKIGAGYLTIRNKAASPDRLVGASSPAAARVETHVTVKEGDIFRMREVKGYEVPANGSFELKPGGAHLMLVDLKQPLKEGERVPLTLRFAKAGEVKTELVVQKGASAAPAHGH